MTLFIDIENKMTSDRSVPAVELQKQFCDRVYTDAVFLKKSANLSDLANKSASRESRNAANTNKRAFRNTERLFWSKKELHYFLLRYAANANAIAPKIAAYAAGSGTLSEIVNEVPSTV